MTTTDLNAKLGDWQGAGYSEAQAHVLAAQLEYYEELGIPYDHALAAASVDVPPDMMPR